MRLTPQGKTLCMSMTHIRVSLHPPAGTGCYDAEFQVGTRAIDSLAQAEELQNIGIEPLRLHGL